MSERKVNIRNDRLYESNDGFSTSIWGEPLWHILHIISFNYPVNPNKEDKKHYEEFILNLRYILPCSVCRINYAQNLKNVRFSSNDLKNRHQFSRFIYRLRQEVNNQIGLGKLHMTYYKIRHAYECFRAQCAKTSSNERGCIKPKNYVKSRIVMKIAPATQLANTYSMNIDDNCYNKLKV